jgi:hypothetical protein
LPRRRRRRRRRRRIRKVFAAVVEAEFVGFLIKHE